MSPFITYYVVHIITQDGTGQQRLVLSSHSNMVVGYLEEEEEEEEEEETLLIPLG